MGKKSSLYQFRKKNCNDNSSVGFILEAVINYSDQLEIPQNELPFLPEK